MWSTSRGPGPVVSAFADIILFNLGFHHSTPTSQPGKFKALCPGWMFHRLPGIDTKKDAVLRPRACKTQWNLQSTCSSNRGEQANRWTLRNRPGGRMGTSCLVYQVGRELFRAAIQILSHSQKTIENSLFHYICPYKARQREQ